ncbi:CD177 antigen-like [Tachyglossus aculeatus]|uniref:CD177 antigen-like n=1 Tax=Tachyglossus aculeatus TaxID=9261 RepID=UPI0018F77392|nr:CD177 antigen-like [Tachyglossus aculeatus]XP_038623420.1 CD177 antigen-like [Tachyglossus aculeatus]
MALQRPSTILLLGLLGVTLTLQGARALNCYRGNSFYLGKGIPSRSEPSNDTCESGMRCQESVIIIQAGPQVLSLNNKGCTSREVQEPQVTRHIRPPGLVVTSYSQVCNSDFCNNLKDTSQFFSEADPGVPSPQGLMCPTCVGLGTSCSSGLVPCPAGTSHCYDGNINVKGSFSSAVSVKGCVQKSCRLLLPGTQAIGELGTQESLTSCCPGGHCEAKPPTHLPPTSVSSSTFHHGLAWLVVGLTLLLSLVP